MTSAMWEPVMIVAFLRALHLTDGDVCADCKGERKPLKSFSVAICWPQPLELIHLRENLRVGLLMYGKPPKLT